MIYLFTDFGAEGPYLGQMAAVLKQLAPDIPIINLLSNAPCADPRRAAYLLAALSKKLPQESVILAVVDPGVGGLREPVVLRADARWFVGPDNGLLNTVASHSHQAEWRMIEWRPTHLSHSFHGRDLFAPVAAYLAMGHEQWAYRLDAGPDLGSWPPDLAEVIYIDHYGNAITGLRFSPELQEACFGVGDFWVHQSRTFCEVAEGAMFWYENSMGLVEIAANRSSAAERLGPHPVGLALRRGTGGPGIE